MLSLLIERYQALQESVRILAAAREQGGPYVRIVVVTKGQPLEAIQPLLDVGHRDFGENRLQEAQAKWGGLHNFYPDLRLHFLGPLQSNKLKEIAENFYAIHSISKIKHLEILASLTKIPAELYLQINIGKELQKSGIEKEEIPSFLTKAQELHIPLKGFMCIPPQGQLPQPFFSEIAELAVQYNLPETSMGMSADWPEAVSCGATVIRPGRLLFS